MSNLDEYFSNSNGSHTSYPLIRLLDVNRGKPNFGSAKVEVIRPRAALGFEPATLSLQFFDKADQLSDYKTEPWDPELNTSLIERGIQAISEENEIQRFGLALAAAFEHPESRYGDGFFSSVLMVVVDETPFANSPSVQAVRPYVSTGKPYTDGNSAEDCRVKINEVLQDRWTELRRQLNYGQAAAERILAGALAYFLDERFGITDGRKLGWLRAR